MIFDCRFRVSYERIRIMKKGAPFNPYLAYEDYAFVSYSHKDSDTVFDIILKLHEAKYRIWYDEGIEAGSEWPQIVAERVLKSALLIVFVSKDFIASQNCRREINYGVSRKKKMVVISLDDSELSEDMQLQLSTAEKIDYKDPEQTANKIREYLDKEFSGSLKGDGVTGYQPVLPKKGRAVNPWFFVSVFAVLLLVGTAAYLVFFAKDRILGSQPVRSVISVEGASGIDGQDTAPHDVEAAAFNDVNSMNLVLKNLNEPYVFLCGNTMVSDSSVIVFKDGGWYVGETVTERGEINDLSCFEGKEIYQLVLVNENLKSLDGIETLVTITYLDISGNPVTDLSGIENLEHLTTIKLLDIPEGTDLTPLVSIPSLKQVYISYDLCDQAAPLIEAGIDVIIKGE